MDTMPPPLVEMNDEWQLWQVVVQRLRERGIEINDAADLNDAICLWGELLVALRVEQTPDIRAEALAERTRRFNERPL